MIGAPALAALGALRAGAGLVKLVMPAPILDSAISLVPSATGIAIPVGADGVIAPHEATALVDRLSSIGQCLAIGMGFGQGQMQSAATLRAAQQQDCPVVFDADSLTSLAGIPELHHDFRASAVLTPHPGEFRRLASSLRIQTDPTDDAARPAAAESLAQRLGCIVVLKGSRTVVSDGQQTWTCESGHPCMATGGTGDVLAGVIAGLIAQLAHQPASHASGKPWSLYDIARLGVEAHARAGAAWAKHRCAGSGMLAAELADEIPAVIEQMRSR